MHFLFFALSLIFCSNALAQVSETYTSHLKLSLISEVSQYKANEKFSVGVLASPDPDWHIYWLNPGDSGSAPIFDWSSSFNAQISEAKFAIPERISLGPLTNFGYSKQSFISFDVFPISNQANEINLKLDTEILVCKEECIPANAKLELKIFKSPSDAIYNSAYKDIFESHRLEQPIEYESVELKAYENADSIFIEGILPPDKKQAKLEFFPTDSLIINNSANQKLKIKENSFELEIKKHSGSAKIKILNGMLVSDIGWANQEKRAQSLSINSIPLRDKAASSQSLLTALLLAFAGGLVLNLMPCVFPVLTIKLFGILNTSSRSFKYRSLGSLSFCFGVIASFLTLAFIIIAARQTGEAIGWGFQLQSPLFVACLILLTFTLSLNFLGVFEIGSSVQNIVSAKQSKLAENSSVSFRYFLDGILVTALATPCTAPFMGTALAYGLSAPALHTVAVFCSLALGVALPFSLLNTTPKLASYLPKPGAWMQNLKKLLAFPLLATCLWLLWVFGLQTSVQALTTLLACLLLCSFAFFLYGQIITPASDRISRILYSSFVVICIIFSVSVVYVYDNKTSDNLNWQEFSEAKVSELRKGGQVVYVDFTAAWCVTCQVNKLVALENKEVVKKFKELNVATLKADWTNKDPEISRTIQSFGREGVPLNIIYPADIQKEPVILPQILTPSAVIAALEQNS